MKVPSKAAIDTKIIWDNKETEWYSWKGQKFTTYLFHVDHKRQHIDCFVNINNVIASELFHCNTNVVAAVDGGSIMYVTCYVSKNTNKEDCAGYMKAAKIIVRNIRKRMEEEKSLSSSNSTSNHEGIDQINVDEETKRSRDGLKILMGSVLANTNAHVVSAPMATWLVRNDSRFGFMNEFQYVLVKTFADGNFNDTILASNYKGSVFVKSQVANYIF